MVLRQPRTTYNNGLPLRRPSPAPNLKDDRCFECQLGARPCIRHSTCLRRNEFAPTPNRFSILSGLSPPPDINWNFDFIPTSRSGPKRRRKRGGKQQRLKHALRKTCEKTESNGVDKLCDRLSELHLENHASSITLQDHNESRSITPVQGSSSDVNAVRHEWAPQFRLDSSREVLCSQNPPKLGQGPSSTDLLPRDRKISPQFPLSAFLKDLVSPTECRARWPPKPSIAQVVSPLQETPPSPSPTATPSPSLTATSSAATAPSSAAIAAASRTIVLCRSTGTSSSNAVKTPEAVPTTSPLSSNTVATNKRLPAIDTPPFTPASGLIPSPPPFLAMSPLPPPMTGPPLVSLREPGPSPAGAASAVLPPTAPSLNFSRLPMLQQISTARAPQRSLFGWQDTSEGINVFHPPPTASVTAPITSHYPFVYPSKPWSPGAVSQDLFKDTASVPSMLRRTFALNCPSPEANLTNFLNMGHANNCWCSKFNHGDPKMPADPTGSYPEDSRAEAISGVSLVNSHMSSSGKGAKMQAPEFLGVTGESIDSEPVDSDGVLVTNTSENASFEFDDLQIIDGQSINSASDDEEWFAVSPRFRTPQLIPSPISWTVSDVSARSSNVSPVYELAAALPSTQQAPTVEANQARGSDNESEIE
ncbi:hypothetical protein SVAN01_01457 [Stagonosporopsis vannaccii]|nr:hypothetical protein SVAN01_01457 [Stagonosporopsis vannaccii]